MEDPIRVVCRVRPTTSKEVISCAKKCLSVENSTEIFIDVKPDSKQFTFDYVAEEIVSQGEFFEKVGLPITETCLQGFNGTIICYGQTGTGKSHTIFGCSASEETRGIVPRTLEYIFDSFKTTTQEYSSEKSILSAKCSFFEIYQERVFDLLSTNTLNSSGLQIREDVKKGVFVDGIVEEEVSSSADANRILHEGYKNRHVGETTMNRESSRSHAIFTLSLNVCNKQESGSTIQRKSKFCLVDLAGSERQRDTQTTGERLKEAGIINKSLSSLGTVINALSEKSTLKVRHINYRDSKLTFLLRDSLGGNAKTVLVATLSPSYSSADETLSTLKFAQRAKSISNVVVLNEETSGSMEALQREIEGLKADLAMATSMTQSTHSSSSDASSPVILKALSSALLKDKASGLEIARRDSEVTALMCRLEQTEKVVLGLEMKVKMRDSEITRLKKAGNSVSTISSPDETLQLTLHDALTARDKAQSELLRYSKAFEELQRRLKSETLASSSCSDLQFDESISLKSVLKVLWSKEEQVSHGTVLEDALLTLTEAFNTLKKSQDSGVDTECYLQTGFHLAEINQMASDLKSVQHALLLSQNREDATGRQNASLQKQLLDAADENQSLKIEANEINLRANRTVSDVQETVKSLQIELREKDFIIQQQEDAMKKTENAASEQLRQQESECKSLYLRAMKDNAVLIRSFRELEANLQNEVATNRSNIEKIELLEGLTATLRSQAELLSVENREARQQFQQSQQCIADFKIEKETMTEKFEESASVVQSLTLEFRQLQGDYDMACFDRDSAQEDNYSNLALVESFRVQQEEQQQLMVELENQRTQMQEELKLNAAAEAAAVSEIATLRGDNCELRDKLAEQTKENCAQLSRHNHCLQKTTQEMSMLKAKMGELESQSQEYLSQLTSATSMIEQLNCSVQRAESDLSTMTVKLADAVNENAAMQTTHEKINNELISKLQSLELEKEALTAAICEHERIMKSAAEEMSMLKAKMGELESQSQEYLSQLTSATSMIEQLNCSVQRAESDLSTMTVKLADAVNENAAMQTSIDKNNNSWTSQLQTAIIERQLLDEKLAAASLVASQMLLLETDLHAAKAMLVARCAENLSLKSEIETLHQEKGTIENLQRTCSALEIQLGDVRNQLATAVEENNRLCGHHNNKQKIQQHMQLKRELMEQSLLVKQLRDQNVQLTLERDQAVLSGNNATPVGEDSGIKTRAATAKAAGGSSRQMVASLSKKYLTSATKPTPLSTKDANIYEESSIPIDRV